MIKTVNSANIDTSKIASLFLMPEKQSIERLAQLFKEEVNKTAITYSKKDKLDYTNTAVHATEVLNLVSDLLNIDIALIKSPTRLTPISDARHIYCFLLIKFSSIKISLAKVGVYINRGHATVLNSVSKTIQYNETSIPFRKKLDTCIKAYTERFYNNDCFIHNYNNIPQY